MWAHPAVKNDHQREILKIFYEWHREPLTKERIEQLLEERGHNLARRTLYRRLESLSKDGVLERTTLPKTTLPTKRGRPPVVYKLDENNIVKKLKQVAALLEAMNFGVQIVGPPGKAYLQKTSILPNGMLRILRLPAKEEDFERNWQLNMFLERLQGKGNFREVAEEGEEDPEEAYKKYETMKHMRASI